MVCVSGVKRKKLKRRVKPRTAAEALLFKLDDVLFPRKRKRRKKRRAK